MIIYGGTSTVFWNDVWALDLTDAQVWSKLAVNGPAPTLLASSAAFDSQRRRVVLFGGDGVHGINNEAWILSLGSDPEWQPVVAAGTPPPVRFSHTAIYDPVGDRMIVFGGSSDRSVPFNDVWELRLGAQPQWTELRPAGTPPAARTEHAAVYDPLRHRMLVFGGAGTNLYNDLWELRLDPSPEWNPILTASAPPARTGHALLYDPARDRLILVCGRAGTSGVLNDTWEFGLATSSSGWVKLQPAHPYESRYLASVVLDSRHDRIVMYGGTPDGSSLGGGYTTFGSTEVMLLSGAPTWTRTDLPRPPPRGAPTVVHSVSMGAVMYGGVGSVWFNDIWSLSFSGGGPAWTQLPSNPPTPSPRVYHSAVYDADWDRMIVFGGSGPAGSLNDTWAYSFGDPGWTQLATRSTTTPSPRYGQSAIMDPSRRRMIIFGGTPSGAGPFLSDAWSLSLDGPPGSEQWAQLHPAGAAPAARLGHAAIYDPLRHRMIVFGGSPWGPLLNDTWALMLGADTLQWIPLLYPYPRPDPRAFASVTYDPVRDRMIILGGSGASGPSGYCPDLSGAWALKLGEAGFWYPLTPLGVVPLTRVSAGLVFDSAADRMLLIGGQIFGFCAGWITTSETWQYAFGADQPTPALISVASVSSRPDEVRIDWYAPAVDPAVAVAQRREVNGGWGVAGLLQPTGWGHLVLEDRGVRPGRSYDYRLALDEPDGMVFSAELRIDVPATAPLSLGGFVPSPSMGVPSVSFSLPDGQPASLEVFDVSGRTLWSAEVGGLGTGVHRLAMTPRSPLVPGVYHVRLTRAGKRLVARGVIVR